MVLVSGFDLRLRVCKDGRRLKDWDGMLPTSSLPGGATDTIVFPPSAEEEDDEHSTATQLQALVVLVQFSDFADDGDGLYKLWKNLSRASDSVSKSALATWRRKESGWRRRRKWKEEEVRVHAR